MPGAVTVARTAIRGAMSKVTLAWTSDASGDVSGHAFAVPAGELLQVKFIPDGGGTQPSDLYDVTLLDANSVDVMTGIGANLSNAVASYGVPLIGDGTTVDTRLLLDGTEVLDLVVANAGNAKGGTVILLIGR